jgi:Uma2 family endonuclease
MVQPVRQWFTFDEYLALEELSTVKHEYLDGQVWAMAGGTPDHAAVCANVTVLLGTSLRGRRCRVYSSDLRVRVRATGLGTYPDVTVICEHVEPDPEDKRGHTALNPRVVVEVLSPSTEKYDRGEKLDHYKQMPSLQEAVLVAHDRREVEVVRREADGTWRSHVFRDAEVARVASLECDLPLVDVYADPLRRTGGEGDA